MTSDPTYGPPEYATYRMLSQISGDSNRSKTRFWKLMCEVDHYILDDLEEDIEFPRYWYQYGEIPDWSGIYIDFCDVDRVVLERDIGRSRFVISDEMREVIDQAVSWVYRKFQHKNTYDLKDYHYEHRAPNDYVRIFDEFRDHLNDSQTYDPQKLVDLLDEMLITYPEKYDYMKSPFLEWEDTTRLFIQNEEFARASSLMSEFWKALSQAELRIHHNHSVSGRTIERWRSEREDIITEFEDQLFDYSEDAIEFHEVSDELDLMFETDEEGSAVPNGTD